MMPTDIMTEKEIEELERLLVGGTSQIENRMGRLIATVREMANVLASCDIACERCAGNRNELLCRFQEKS